MVYFAMAHLSGTDHSQLLLLPEAVDDHVGPDNPVRFIAAFVDGLDLKAAGLSKTSSDEAQATRLSTLTFQCCHMG